MTQTETQLAGDGDTTTEVRDTWDQTLPRLRERYPNASDGILFCVNKLELDRDVSLKDFRDEARLRGIGLSGRSIHSAKVLLGMEKPSVRKAKPAPPVPIAPRAKVKPAARPTVRRAAQPKPAADSSSFEDVLRGAVSQLQAEATDEARQLRTAMRQAIEVLQGALDERPD